MARVQARRTVSMDAQTSIQLNALSAKIGVPRTQIVCGLIQLLAAQEGVERPVYDDARARILKSRLDRLEIKNATAWLVAREVEETFR